MSEPESTVYPPLTQNRGRIDHIAFIVREENFEATVARVASVLSLNFEGPFDNTELGFRVVIDWHAGIEFLTPYDREKAPIQFAYLDKYGEGFYRLIFGVSDMESSLDRAKEHGLRVGIRMDGLTLTPDWAERFDRIEEVTVEKPVPGFYLTLGQIEPKSGT
ncbi:hypothetical protein [Arthrobacter sp. ISL-28]|uniref:hypothetical protein n=1 Tax=Arthrobacter sp. ISL-28 TaxID=2819108 RepID=UPI001BE82E8E|nr:hypothetical protein [Arthrobacter sp. ISL-28]MBT2523326.1 hypothetical protein [Arthrobacter sp. ISL-28]